ncbi:hypothetical protein [Kribbella koreensis]|uniref:hypothetical protein n=1 Tax=Kribbella koreensis TaxID=57909 RepID=UPI0031D045FE
MSAGHRQGLVDEVARIVDLSGELRVSSQGWGNWSSTWSARGTSSWRPTRMIGGRS